MSLDIPPTLRVLEDGRHVAVCRTCGHQSPVKVTHRRVPHRRFALTARWDNDLQEWVPDEVATGEQAFYDWSEHERHDKEAHG